MVHLLILHVLVWWSGWAFRDVQWHLGSFSLALSAPALLYVASNALVSSDPSRSLREHFHANRSLFFAARGLLVVSAVGASILFLDVPLLNPARLIAVLLLAICVVGVASANHRVQAIIAVLGLLTEIFLVGYLRFDPGSWYGAQ